MKGKEKDGRMCGETITGKDKAREKKEKRVRGERVAEIIAT